MQLAPETLRIRKRAAMLSLSVGVVLMVVKLVAYRMTNSTAILSDAMESVVHILATGFAYYSVVLSSRPADEAHPYGHGKVEFFSAGFEGALIVIAAGAIFYTAVPQLFQDRELPNLDIAAGVSAGVGLINFVLARYLISVGRKSGSFTLVADGRHVLTDSVTSAGVFVGLVVVILTGWPIFDPLIAMAVAINILITGWRLVRESISGLMDETDMTVIGNVCAALNDQRKAEWIDVHLMRCWKSGEILHLDFHITLPYYLNIAQAHGIEKDLQSLVARQQPGPTQLLLHQDPCAPVCCSFCAVPDCEFRQHICEEQKHFTPREVIRDVSYPRKREP